MSKFKFPSDILPADLDRQNIWSRTTFGPGSRLKGVIKHIQSELVEVEVSDGKDLSEWIDIIILALDGAYRAGFTGEDIINAYHAKMDVNYNRDWPDWHNFSEDEPIEHDRSKD